MTELSAFFDCQMMQLCQSIHFVVSDFGELGEVGILDPDTAAFNQNLKS